MSLTEFKDLFFWMKEWEKENITKQSKNSIGKFHLLREGAMSVTQKCSNSFGAHCITGISRPFPPPQKGLFSYQKGQLLLRAGTSLRHHSHHLGQQRAPIFPHPLRLSSHPLTCPFLLHPCRRQTHYRELDLILRCILDLRRQLRHRHAEPVGAVGKSAEGFWLPLEAVHTPEVTAGRNIGDEVVTGFGFFILIGRGRPGMFLGLALFLILASSGWLAAPFRGRS